MPIPFDPADYVRAPIITVSSGIALASALVDACPKTYPQGVKKAAKHLEKITALARAELAERGRVLGTISDDDSRVLDNEADRAWGGLRGRLQAMAMLPHERFPAAKRAAELDAQLFCEGIPFLKAEYGTQSSAMAALLQRIDDEGLARELDVIAGHDFLKELRHVQPRYEAMVRERLKRDKATGQNLSETTRALQAAIVNYATKVIATIELDEPDTMETARLALLPIANHREAAAARGSRAAPVIVTGTAPGTGGGTEA